VSALRLQAVAGAQRGPELVFPGPRVRIGRSRDNDVVLPDRTPAIASGHHAEAVRDTSGVWWIVDLDSSNGTRLNGVAIRRHQLKNGDRLTFGDEQFVVALASPASRVWIGVLAVLTALIAGSVLRMERNVRVPFEDVATHAPRSVFLIAIEENGQRTIVGTAFAVDDARAGVEARGTLATNAHIVDALRRRGALPSHTLAIQSDSYATWPVVSAAIHPDWRAGSLHADVALLRLPAGGPRVPSLTLADAATVAALGRGTPVAALGFPAVSTDPANPRARLSVDVVGDVRGEFLEVGLDVAPGTSGSPVFDRSGSVVGMVVGGDFIAAPGGGTRPSGSSANWALSAASIRQLLDRRD